MRNSCASCGSASDGSTVLIPDANVLLYAVNEDAPQHAQAHGWLDRALSGQATVGFAWVVLLAFVRLSTRVGLFPNPLPVDAALGVVRGWLGQPSAVVLEPGPRHVETLASLLGPLGAGGNLTNDAHLAALAVVHRGQVVSYDVDFARFAGVRWSTPANA